MELNWLQWTPRPLRNIIDPVGAAGVRLAGTVDWSQAVPGRPTVLCLERSQFIKDIEELRRLTDLNWITVNAVKLKQEQERWVPKADRQQGYFSTWLKEERSGHLRPVLTRFATTFLKTAAARMPIDAVISANIDYWQDEAMKLACRELGIPFLVLCRENYTIPWTVPWHHDYLKKARFHFGGAGLAVFSQATKDAFAPSFDSADDIWVTGAPRYDRWLHLETSKAADKRFVSLITFNDPGYMAVNTFMDVAKVFDSVARQEAASDLTWLVKCKKRGDKTEVLERLGSLNGSPLKFEHDTQLFDLYPRSRAIVGYNSLALVEAMLTDVPVIVPCWDETRPKRDDLLIDFNDPLARRVINFADSPEQLRDLLQRAARGEELPTGSPEDRRALFRAHLHDPSADGGSNTASANTEAFIRYYIDEARNADLATSA